MISSQTTRVNVRPGFSSNAEDFLSGTGQLSVYLDPHERIGYCNILLGF
jgi:hypothetical protein